MQTEGWLADPQYDAGLEELARLDRADAAAFAARCRVLARLAARTSREGWQGEAPFDSLVLDVAGTCLLGQIAAGSRLVDAEHLVVRLPRALAALEAGSLRVPQAQVLVEQTRSLTPQTCAEVERRVLGRAGDLCPADLRRLLRRVVLAVDAEAVARREASARRGRRTWVRPAEDGMALLCALLPAEQAQAAQATLTEQARQVRSAGDGRCVDQLRADLLVAALAPGAGQPACATGAAAAPRAGRRRPGRPVRVVVHVPLAVARGLSDEPAELEGHGPISAAHARRLLAGAELWRACSDPATARVWALDQPERQARGRSPGRDPAADLAGPGHPGPRPLRQRVEVDRRLDALAGLPPPRPLPAEARHDPSAALVRLVRVRDARCDGPGCSLPAPRCELDHEVPWPAGETSPANLVVRSQRCHHAKHAGWSAERHREGTTWTSPGGRRYAVPSRHVLGGPVPGTSPSRRTRRAAALRARGVLLVHLDELAPPPVARRAGRGGPPPGERPADDQAPF